MRIVHLARPGTTTVQPWCGSWGGLDTDWTDDPDRVTCEACRAAYRQRAPAAPPPAGPSRDGRPG